MTQLTFLTQNGLFILVEDFSNFLACDDSVSERSCRISEYIRQLLGAAAKLDYLSSVNMVYSELETRTFDSSFT